MQPRTGLAAVLVVAVLAGTAVLGFGAVADSGGSLTERWVSTTASDTRANHHAPAAGRIDGSGMVFAPISGEDDTDQCALVAQNASDGSSRWREPIPSANCTIHAVADPLLADFVGDDTREVIAATTEQEVAAYDPRTGELVFQHDLTDYGYTQPVVADLTGDGTNELVAVDVRGTVSVLRPDGTTAWTATLDSYTWGQPTVADFDGDSGNELVVGTSSGRLVLFESDGSVVWNRSRPFASSITWMTTGQADDDRATEIVTATDGGRVVAIDGERGAVQWRRDLGAFAAVHAFGDGDGDNQSEVYAVAKDGTLRSLDASDGSVEWTTQLTTESVQMMPPPSLGDVDGDGNRELVATTNDGIVSVVDPRSGDVLASYDRDVPIYVHPTVVDTDDDGTAEVYVVYGDGRVVALSYDD
ncbi:outer membrane protein assembly factor BamB family protein [Halococcus agarilyticus]|uniref:outer membrane protein assembly factor BamB family protein n=1 Tax=Halococcus agarilyticus TaxID=1232219 RepID=UPI0006776142|nr:PQQ-binding-like beta-propeller repeat protein [Halococcus agarilyticus]